MGGTPRRRVARQDVVRSLLNANRPPRLVFRRRDARRFPARDARLALVPTSFDGRVAFATTDLDGRFVVKTLAGTAPPPGVYRVTVAKYRVENPYTAEEIAELARYDFDLESFAKSPAELLPNRPDPTVVSTIPKRYARAETSGLTLVLPEGGAQNLRLEMTSDAK